MKATEVAVQMLESVPANVTLGIRVLRALDGVGEVEMDSGAAFANFIGSLHASGLIGLVDASCLTAIISAAEHAGQLVDVVPLGAQADLKFRAPAHGRLVGRCRLPDEDRHQLQEFYAGAAVRAHLTTAAEVVDCGGATVCSGAFRWSLHR